MDIYKYLVRIKEEDKTEEISNYISDNGYMHINFKNSETIYTYLKKDIEFYKDPIQIDIQKYKLMINHGYVYNAIKVIKFERH